MRFPYQGYPVRGTGPLLYTMAWRPVVSVRVIGPGGDDVVPGLIDTGSDDTLLPDFLIGPLGVALDPDDVGEIGGIDGGLVTVRYGTIDLELSDPSMVYCWNARVGFHARHNAIFGHVGFLDYFSAMFNGRTREVVLLPNGMGPLPAYP
jgi:hypothetical protein